MKSSNQLVPIIPDIVAQFEALSNSFPELSTSIHHRVYLQEIFHQNRWTPSHDTMHHQRHPSKVSNSFPNQKWLFEWQPGAWLLEFQSTCLLGPTNSFEFDSYQFSWIRNQWKPNYWLGLSGWNSSSLLQFSLTVSLAKRKYAWWSRCFSFERIEFSIFDPICIVYREYRVYCSVQWISSYSSSGRALKCWKFIWKNLQIIATYNNLQQTFRL